MSLINNPTNLQVNISSLIGQLSLKRTETALSQSIRNLSSGIQIHSGRDNPVGFVASTAMQTDIRSMTQAVANCQKADSVISTADSTLSTLNNLLIDLRALVTQAANTGGESAETLASIQLQADVILDTIDRTANSTSFQSQKLIDGSLDFSIYGLDRNRVTALNVYQANFLGRTEKDIAVQVLEPPRQAELYYSLGALKNDVTLDIGGRGGYQTFSFDKEATVNDIADAVNRFSDATGVGARVYSQSTPGALGLTSYGKDNDIILTASKPGVEAGNFLVKYTAPKDGNDTLSLKVTPGTGNEPSAVEVVLETEAWQQAEYHYNGENDGIADNEFTIAARYAGKEFNDIEFVVNNVFGTDGATGLEVDLGASPKRVVMNVSYNEANPADPANTTVSELESWFADSPVAATYFEFRHTEPSDGSGPVVPSSSFTQSKQGVDGGAVLTTAEEVATLINTSPLLKNPDGSGQLSATLPTGSTGQGVVSPFAEYSYYGDPSQSNYLQFLAPQGTPNIRFVSTPGTPLSIDDSSMPSILGNAEAKIQGLDPGTTFTLRSLQPGADGDGIGVIFRDASEESVVFDAQRNAVVVSVDFTGRAEDPDREAFTMDDLRRIIGQDPFVGSRYTVIPDSAYNEDDPPKFENTAYRGINAQLGETSGGVISEGTILIHLETDAKGIVKTTANDLVKFFNDPPTDEARSILDQLGISVSNIDPNNSNLPVCTTGMSANGTGVLRPTYDPADCLDTTGMLPDLTFSSSQTDVKLDYPLATVSSQNGVDASFTIMARQAGSTYNNTAVSVEADSSGPRAHYNPVTGELKIGIPPGQSMTADEIIALVNEDPALNEWFVAGRAPHSTGEGTVAIGDRAVMTGGVKASDRRAEGHLYSSNGIESIFSVQAKKSDAIYADTEIRIVAGDGPTSVSYDPQSRQLTVAVSPTDPPTAGEIVRLINDDPEVSKLFEASIPKTVPGTSLVPTGEGRVQVGDSGKLTVPASDYSPGVALIGSADQASLGLTFYSLEFGSGEFVSVLPSTGSDFPLTDRFGNSSERTYGTDIKALIDGQLAIGNGRIASTATSDLDMAICLEPDIQKGEVIGFRITGGGALIQLGPDAVSSHQARIGIKNMHSVSLGGVSGHLSQLRQGEPYDLLTNTTMAFKIIEEVTTEIATLRGRLGAFQKTQIRVNMDNLVDSIEIESGALSEVRDVDFAAESSNLMRQQLLMQSNVSVLQQAGQMSQMLLGLLQR